MFVAVLPTLSLWPLVFAIPLPLALLAVRAPTTRSTLLPMLVVQMAMWLWVFRWIIPVTAAGYPALALYHTIHAMLLVWVLRRIAKSRLFARLPMTLVLPLVWTAMEYFRGEVAFDGYPWYMIGQPLIHWLMFAQSSDLLGMYFMSFLAAVPAGVMLDALRLREAANQSDGASRRGIALVAMASVLMLFGNLAYGLWRMAQTDALSPGPRIVAIQTNLPQSNKVGWSAEQQAIDVPIFMQQTREAVATASTAVAIDLIAWPETMLPSLGFEPGTRENIELFGSAFAHLTRWMDEVEALSRDELQTPMLVGSSAWVGTSVDITADGYAQLEREREYNSAYLIQGQQPYQRYDKAVLTPFGETMPYISRWKWLERQMLALGARGMQFNLDASKNVGTLTLEGRSRTFEIGTPICFEDTVASLCRRMAYSGGRKRADVFVNISNDGWFGASASDRILHAQIARFRCIENRVPMVRCVNTGVTVHIDSAGRIVGHAGESPFGTINQPGWMVADVQLDARATLFGRIGHAFPIACMLLILSMLITTFIAPQREPTSDRIMTMRSHVSPTIPLLVATFAAALSWGGCASDSTVGAPDQRTRSVDQWSSKTASTQGAMPDRPEFDMGQPFAVAVDETNLRQAALEILDRAVDSTNPLLRMNAIEGFKHAPQRAVDAVRKGLGDDNRAVRFASTMIVGDLRLTSLRALVEPLLLDESDSVRAAAIYAIRRCGGKADKNPLAAMLLGDDPEVKGNAAIVLGRMGDQSALSLLRYGLSRGLMAAGSAQRRIIELQMAEAMVKLGDLQQLEVIRAALFSRPEEGEIIALACQICGEVRDEGSMPNLHDLATRTGRQQQSAEIRMAAAMAVARINPRRAILGVPEAYVSSARFELRAQAALTLAAGRQRAALPTLMRMMQDSNPLVQVSAAAAVLEIGEPTS